MSTNGETHPNLRGNSEVTPEAERRQGHQILPHRVYNIQLYHVYEVTTPGVDHIDYTPHASP